MNGELRRKGDAWELRFRRELPHPPEKVWRAITEPEHLEAWFPGRIRGDFVAGGSIRFDVEAPDVPPFEGEVFAVEPPTLLEFSWGPDVLRFEITPGNGGCTLILTDTLEELGKAARDGAGWHVCLDKLEYDLQRAAAPWTDSDRWKEVHPSYVEALGPEAATLGPPESM